MPTIQNLLDKKARKVVSIGVEATVLEAARMMNEHHIGALVVTRGDKVVGIFTERDVLNRIVAAQRDPAQTSVETVMSSPIAVCGPDTTRAECRVVMKSRRIRHLPVVVEDRLVGIVSIGDIIEDNEEEQEETIRHLYEYMMVR